MESARPKVWIETMDKEATSCASYLNGYVNGRFREKSQLETLGFLSSGNTNGGS